MIGLSLLITKLLPGLHGVFLKIAGMILNEFAFVGDYIRQKLNVFFFFLLLFVGMGTSELRFKEGDRASMVRKKAADGYNQKLSWNQLYVLGYENLFSSKHLNFNSNV